MKAAAIPCLSEGISKNVRKVDIAREMGKSWQTVYNWFNGKRKLAPHLRQRFAEVAGLPPDFDWQRYEEQHAAISSTPAPVEHQAISDSVEPPAAPAPRRLTAKPPAGWPQIAQPSRPLPTPRKVTQPHQAGGKSASPGFFGFGG